MRLLACLCALAWSLPAAALEVEAPGTAAQPVQVRPVFLEQLGGLIGARTDFGPFAYNPPEIELANLEALTVRRDQTPAGVARAEAAKLLVAYLAHPEQLQAQRQALAQVLGQPRVEFLQRRAAFLRVQAQERPVLAERLAALEKSVPEPALGVDGSLLRLEAVFDGWTERWETAAPLPVPGLPRFQTYSLFKPDGRLAERRKIQVPRAPKAAAKAEPFSSDVSALTRRAERLLSGLAPKETLPEFSDWRLMGGTLAAASLLFGLAGVFLGVPLSWKLLAFAPAAAGALFFGRSLGRRAMGRVSALWHGTDAKTQKALASPEAADKLWDARERHEARGGIATMTGALLAFLSGGWLAFAPALVGAWVSTLLGTPVSVYPPLWSYLAAAAGFLGGIGLIGWAWGLSRATAFAETTAELVGLDGTRKPARDLSYLVDERDDV